MENSAANSLDDNVSGLSEWDYQDHRLSQLEQRLQQQEDEITLLKSALADALRRICFYDQHFATLKGSLPGSPSLQSTFSASGLIERPSAKRSQSLSSASDLSHHTATSFTGTKERRGPGIETLHRVRVQHPRGRAAVGVFPGSQEAEFRVRNPPSSLVSHCLSHNDPHPIQRHTSSHQPAGVQEHMPSCQVGVERPGFEPDAWAAPLQLEGEGALQLCEGDPLPVHWAEPGAQQETEGRDQQPPVRTEIQPQPAETRSGDRKTQGPATRPGTESIAALETSPQEIRPIPLLPLSQDKAQQYSPCSFQALPNGIPAQQWSPRLSQKDRCPASSQAVISVAPLNVPGSQPKAETLPPLQPRPEAAPHSDVSQCQLENDARASEMSPNGSECLQQELPAPPATSPNSAQAFPPAACPRASQAPAQTHSAPVSQVLPQPQGSLEEPDTQPRAPRSISQAAQLSPKDGVCNLPPVTASAISKKLVLRRSNTSDKLGMMRNGAADNGKPKLSRKSVSSVNLLTKSRNADSRGKDPFLIPAPASRRAVYNQGEL
ncbi:uncharacterized protein [Scyliorhinus torazame]|uniref:uncharacterized protein n=1 Tax=Scyliorhinus torazame TaxID=75743 RepID=UPI003B5B4496